MSRTRKSKSTVINTFHAAIFGGDGDLSKRKIIPAFYHRFAHGQINVDFDIYCITRKTHEEKEFKAELKKFISATLSEDHESVIDSFLEHIRVLQLAENNVEPYQILKKHIEKDEERQRLYYFSVPSSAFSEICDALQDSRLINDKSKVVLEKPLGIDLESSHRINNIISKAFQEKQIFRIDHYLGKETVQNIMVLRFANHLFELSLIHI